VASFTIHVVASGEELIYVEENRRYYFDVSLETNPVKLWPGRYRTGSPPDAPQPLSDAERNRILPRLIDFLRSGGERVRVMD
jgi:hypothetical protein